MEIKTLVQIKTSKGWRDAGSIIDFPRVEADRLIRLGAGIAYQEDPETEVIEGGETGVVFDTLNGMEDNFKDELIELGFDTVESLAAAKVADLTPVNGIGKVTAEKLIASAIEALESSEDE